MKKRYLFLFIAIIPVIMMAAGLWALFESPYTGLNFEYRDNNKWYIKSVDPGSPASIYPGITGYRVVSIGEWAISGKELMNYTQDIKTHEDFVNFFGSQRYFASNIVIGKPLDIVVEKNGTTKTIVITPGHQNIYKILAGVSVKYSIALFFLLIALLIIYKQPANPVAMVYYIASLMVNIICIALGFIGNKDIALNFDMILAYNIVNTIAVYIALASTFHFSIIFPRVTPLAKNKFFIVSFYSIAIILAVILWPRTYSTSLPMFIYTILTVIFVAYNYIMISSPVEKAQVKWVVWGFMIGCISLLFFLILPSPAGDHSISQNILMLFLALTPISIAFAITRYKLMDIDTLFDNTLVYTITIALLAIIDVVLVYILTSNKIPLLQFNTTVSTIIAVWVIIFAYLPIRNLVQKQIKKILKREIYDTNAVSMELSKELLSVSDTQSAFDKATDVINNALHPKGNSILLNQHGSIVMENTWLTREQLNTVSSPIHLYQLGNMDALPKNYAGGICIPIIGTQRSLGYLILQDKHSERLYDKEDIKLLSIISAQLAMTIEAIMAREEKEREKEKISREIHDGLGSTFSKAKLLIRNFNHNASALEELENTIDDGLKDIRELLWAVEQGESTLNDVVFYIQEKTKYLKNVLTIEILTEMDDGSITLSPIMKLNIVRIIQEAVTNTIKHAQATKIGISFIQHDDSFVVRIADNGTGFDTELATHRHYGLRNMKKRCSEIRGELKIVSGNGEGTEISVIIKL